MSMIWPTTMGGAQETRSGSLPGPLPRRFPGDEPIGGSSGVILGISNTGSSASELVGKRHGTVTERSGRDA